MSEYPDHVPREDRPDPTPENIPDDLVRSALATATVYGACPECGEKQFFPRVTGHNTDTSCSECGQPIRIVG
jgi:uncharacterized protein (DUF983 family)